MNRLDYAALVEDVTFMVAHGEHPARVAHRLGKTVPGLNTALRRAGRPDLAAYFHNEERRKKAA